MVAPGVVGTASGGSNSGNFSVTPPAGAASYVAIVELTRDTGAGTTLTAPSGWTLLSSGDSASGVWWSRWKIYTGTSSAGSSWTFSDPGHCSVVVIGLDNTITSATLTTTTSAVASGFTSVACPDATLTEAALVVRAVVGEADADGAGNVGNPATGTLTYPAAATLARADAINGATAATRAARVSTAAESRSAGAAGTATFALSSAGWTRPVQHTLVIVAPGSTTYPAAGTITAVSGVTGSVAAGLAAAGTITATSTVAGDAPAQHAVSGTVAAVTTVTGSPTAQHPVTGTVAAVSATSGTVAASLVASGTVAAVSAVAGSASVNGGAQSYPVSGTVAATTTAAGAVTAAHAVGGTVAAASTASGAVGAVLVVSGVVSSVTAVTGSLTATLAVSGTVPVVSGVTGTAGAGGTSGAAVGTVVIVSTVAGAVQVISPRDVDWLGITERTRTVTVTDHPRAVTIKEP